MVPRDEVVELDMEIETAVKMIVSLGVVVPAESKQAVQPSVAPSQPAP
jgi:uncharacterized membrane protein